MPGIGRPNTNSNSAFKGIAMAPKENSKYSNSKNTVGDELNKISGYKDESKFVSQKEHNKLGKDGFMKLLAHQMQNQDPMNPMDQKQFAADLAQFSQLEQLTNLNTTLKAQANNAPQETKFYGASFLGKKIMTRGTSVHFDGENDAQIPFNLKENASKVVVRVLDSKNQIAKQLEFENMNKGSQKVAWDGIAADNAISKTGDYTIQVYAWGKDMNPFRGETQSTGVVTGVHFENGETILTVDGKKSVFLRDVESFELPRDNKKTLTPKSALNSYGHTKQLQ